MAAAGSGGKGRCLIKDLGAAAPGFKGAPDHIPSR